MPRSVLSSNSRARSIRASINHSAGERPVASRKRRMKVRGLIAAARAIDSIVKGSCTRSPICAISVASRSSGARLQRALDELRLSAVAMRRHDQTSRNLIGDAWAVVASHEMQTQIESRRAAGRREDLARIDVQHIRIDAQLRILRLQLVRVTPMRRDFFVRENAGRGEHEHAGANRDESCAASVRCLQCVDELARRRDVGAFPSRNHDRAGLRQHRQICLRGHAACRPLRASARDLRRKSRIDTSCRRTRGAASRRSRPRSRIRSCTS